ncbi:MAG: hypothetical protein H6747_11330 [Deltaproteobacteria bacterium]|nr:hypothetical protein [Deltaproteobacteria bacterium]
MLPTTTTDSEFAPLPETATDLLLHKDFLPPRAGGGYPTLGLSPRRALAQLVPALLRDAGLTDESARATSSTAVREALMRNGRRLPTETQVRLRTRLVDQLAARRPGVDGIRPIDRALQQRAAHQERCAESDRAVLASAYDALEQIAAAPARVYELQSAPNAGRAWVVPLGGGRRVIADIVEVRPAQRGGLVVGHLVEPTWTMPTGEAQPVPTFLGAPIGFDPTDRTAMLETLHAAGGSSRDADAALPALFALAAERSLAREAEANRRERLGLSEGWIIDSMPYLTLLRCDDPDALALAAVEARMCETWDDSSVFVMLPVEGERAGPMADMNLDDGEIWLRSCEESYIDAVVAALADLGVASLERIPLVPQDEDGALLDVH